MKEKKTKKIVFVVQNSLYNKFRDTCEREYRTMSDVIREFMNDYIKRKILNNDKKPQNNSN